MVYRTFRSTGKNPENSTRPNLGKRRFAHFPPLFSRRFAVMN
jgi:hypothetical protein